MENTATLLLYCEDRKGLVFAIARFILEHGGNILHADQHQDAALGLFFMRIQWSLAGFDLDQEAFPAAFGPLAAEYGFTWQVVMGQKRPAVAIFVSRYQHCLIDLLYRHQIGELPCQIALVISNHEDARDLAHFYNVAFSSHSGQRRPIRPRLKKSRSSCSRKTRLNSSCWPGICRFSPPSSWPLSAKDHQCSSLVSARLCRRQALPCGLRAWGKTYRRHQPLCDPGTRRGAHY